MNQAELVLRVRDVVKAAGIKTTKDKVEFILRTILSEIEAGLREEGQVRLGNWGKFRLRDSNGTHYNIKTKVVQQITPSKIVHFKVGRPFKKAVQPPKSE